MTSVMPFDVLPRRRIVIMRLRHREPVGQVVDADAIQRRRNDAQFLRRSRTQRGWWCSDRVEIREPGPAPRTRDLIVALPQVLTAASGFGPTHHGRNGHLRAAGLPDVVCGTRMPGRRAVATAGPAGRPGPGATDAPDPRGGRGCQNATSVGGPVLPVVRGSGCRRRLGYFWALELVADKDTRVMFSPADRERLLRGFLSPTRPVGPPVVQDNLAGRYD